MPCAAAVPRSVELVVARDRAPGARRWLARHGSTRATRDRRALWEQFVAASARRDAAAARGDARPTASTGLGHVAFRIGLSSLGIGAEPVGQLALAIERALDREAASTLRG